MWADSSMVLKEKYLFAFGLDVWITTKERLFQSAYTKKQECLLLLPVQFIRVYHFEDFKKFKSTIHVLNKGWLFASSS